MKRVKYYVLLNGQQPGTVWPLLNEEGSLKLFDNEEAGDAAVREDTVARVYGYRVRRLVL